MRDLSVLIPARNEQFLARTIEDVLSHIKGETEIIVVLDGAWAEPGIPQHPRVQLVHLPTAIGQRAATNLAAHLSNARYIMKLDAHCSVADGFDVALVEAAGELGPDVTQIPAQFNLHVFDWVCPVCQRREYQGPTPVTCLADGCAGMPAREMVWQPRKRRLTEFWRFDSDLHFQYWNAYKERPEAAGEFPETLSCLGACWFMSRERYFALDGLDEDHGSWGGMGTEIACKSWLSGGRMVTNRRTWFAHLFRTQGGDFGFPYALTADEQNYARRYSQNLWRGNNWPKAVKPLRWLLEKFAPVPGWMPEQIDALPKSQNANPKSQAPKAPSLTKGCVYYSDCRLEPDILRASRRTIEASGLPIVSVTLAPSGWPAARNVVLPLERGVLTMFRQILAGLEALNSDLAFLVEHDVLYHPSHFEFQPARADRYYYNTNVWKVNAEDGRALHYVTQQTSGLCANRELLIEHYRKRIATVERDGFSRKMGFEPGTHGRAERVDDVQAESWQSAFPNVDIRHGLNLTPSRWRQDQFRNQRFCAGWTEADVIPGWAGTTRGRFQDWLREQSQVVSYA